MNKQLFTQLLNTGDSFSPLSLRLIAGIILAAHGAQKLFGWFGGYGLEGTGQWMASIGLEPGFLMALLAGSVEFFGGLALIAGFLVRPVSLLLSLLLVVAIFSVHFENGLFMANNGYEFGLALFGMTFSLSISGAGRLSIDRLLNGQIQRSPATVSLHTA